MFSKSKSCFAICLQFSLLLSITFNLSAASFNCGTETVEVCKTKFEADFSDKLKLFTFKELQREVNDLLNIFDNTLKDLPADSSNAKILQKCMKDMKEAIEEFESNLNDFKKMHTINDRIIWNMSPHQMYAPANQSKIYELESALNKHGYKEKMDTFESEGIMMAMVKFWTESFANLRDIDRQTYPEYDQIKTDMEMIRKPETNLKEKDKLFGETLKKMRNSFHIPLFEDFIFAKRN